MKKIILFIVMALGSFAATAQQQVTHWDVFATATCTIEFETGNARQNFIKVKQVGNRFYWGEDNYYDVYNREEIHEGFMTIVTYDFIDKHKQRGRLIYQFNQNADWATRHMFYIFYENDSTGMVYLSNDPKKDK